MLESRLARGVAWSFIGVLISKGFLLISFILISRVTSVSAYGQIGIIKSSMTTFSLLGLASFGLTATRYISLRLKKDKESTSRILTLTFVLTLMISLLICILINVFSNDFTTVVLGSDNLIPYITFISLSIFLGAIFGFLTGALAGFEKFKQIAIVHILFGLFSIPLLFIGTKIYGVRGFCIGMLLLYFLALLFSFFFLGKAMIENQLRLTFCNIKQEFYILKEFSLPAFMGSSLISPTILICNSVLVSSLDGYVQMGIYDAAFTFSVIAMAFNAVIGQVLFPSAMKRAKLKDDNYFDFVNINMPWLIGVFFAIVLIYLPDIFSQIFDNSYQNRDMHLTVSTIALFIVFTSHRQGISRNLAALNRMWYSFLDNLLWGIIAIAFTYYLLDFGAFGRALAFVIAYFINSIVILPIYLKLDIFKMSYLLSNESISIWIILIISYISSFFYINIIFRILVMLLVILILLRISFNWFRKSTALFERI